MISRLVESLGTKPFRPGGRALNAAFYDSFTVSLSSILEKRPNLSSTEIASAYETLKEDSDFIKLISSSTADDENVKARFGTALRAFSNAHTS